MTFQKNAMNFAKIWSFKRLEQRDIDAVLAEYRPDWRLDSDPDFGTEVNTDDFQIHVRVDSDDDIEGEFDPTEYPDVSSRFGMPRSRLHVTVNELDRGLPMAYDVAQAMSVKYGPMFLEGPRDDLMFGDNGISRVERGRVDAAAAAEQRPMELDERYATAGLGVFMFDKVRRGHLEKFLHKLDRKTPYQWQVVSDTEVRVSLYGSTVIVYDATDKLSTLPPDALKNIKRANDRSMMATSVKASLHLVYEHRPDDLGIQIAYDIARAASKWWFDIITWDFGNNMMKFSKGKQVPFA